VHQGWNNLVEMTPITSEFVMEEHSHGHDGDIEGLKNFYTALLTVLVASPVFAYSVRRIRRVNA